MVNSRQQKQKVTVEDVINQIGNGPFQWISIGLLCSLTNSANIIQIVNMSMVLQQFSEQLSTPLSASQQGILIGVIQIGMMIGNLLVAPVVDIYGRRFTNITTTAIFTIFGILQVFSVNYKVMLACRFMIGFGTGACINSIIPTIAEFSPTYSRGTYFGVFNLAYSCGQVFVPLVAWITVDQLGWQVFLMLTNIPSIVAFLGIVLYIPETPQFLMSRQKVKESKKVVSYIAQANGKSINEEILDQLGQYEGYLIMEQQPQNVNKNLWTGLKESLQPMVAVWKFPYTISTLCIITITFSLQSAFIIYDSWFPTIFAEYGADLNVYLQTTISMLVQIPGSVVALFIVDCAGRKLLIMCSTILSALSLVPTLIFPNIGFVILASISASMTVNAVVWNPVCLLLVELYPTSMRGVAASIGAFPQYIGAFALGSLVPIFLEINQSLIIIVPIILYVICAAATLPLRETKGVQLLEETEQQATSSSDDDVQTQLLQ